jgi:hypothetical protein
MSNRRPIFLNGHFDNVWIFFSEMIFDNFMMKLRKIPLEEGDEDIRQGQNSSNEENVPQALKVP